MHDQDATESGDAALSELLTALAERTADPTRKKLLLECLSSIRPLAQWPEEDRDRLRDTCVYVTSLARLSRELDRLNRS